MLGPSLCHRTRASGCEWVHQGVAPVVMIVKEKSSCHVPDLTIVSVALTNQRSRSGVANGPPGNSISLTTTSAITRK
jgi:hypothetical protein